MTLDSNERFELRRLIIAAQDGELTDGDRERLEAFVLSPGGADEAAAMLDQLSALEDSTTFNMRVGSRVEAGAHDRVFGPQASDAAKSGKQVARPEGSATSWRGISLWLIATGAAILILSHVSIGVLSWSFAQRKMASVARTTELPDQIVGAKPVEAPESATSYLVSTTACVWFPSRSSTPKVGQSMRSGETISLIEGIAELGFGPSGNDRVRIEGPANAFIRPDGVLSLQSGALVADVADGSPQHFVIETAMGPVLAANGTSMGIVMNLESMDLHVFKGRVTVDAGTDQAQGSLIELSEGEAVRFTMDSDGEMEIIFHDASASKFASARSMGFDPLKISAAYVNTILEADPVIYWRFEKSVAGAPRRIENLGSLSDFDAVVNGDVRWRQYASNRVAEFGLSDVPSVITSERQWPTKKLEEYTIELWIKPTCFHHGSIFCLTQPNPNKNNGHDHGMIFEVGARHWSTLQHLDPNRVRFVHRAPVSNDYKTGTSLLSRDVYKPRTWQHWAVRKKGEVLSMLVDGEVVDVGEDPNDLSPDLNVVIGQLYPDLSHRPFIGQLDEVAVYERALSDTEIQSHYRAVKAPAHTDAKPNDFARVPVLQSGSTLISNHL
ncbi:LamG domain-containing protein [Aporhodopirellula aestuarii]|uniref:LamG domain-containing protein n=1 Tax=Aporhodopirellula aestuarii TaxID=2950107 RepID=A0ABT0U5U3_9BACT|nr:LamG domain-containing protein [Aporhodopirellula aestuarii]MCM2371783.1 LamG domain-containing protein [Aporhodopirellula aestuarii]